MKLTPIDTFQVSPRRRIEPGAVVRFSGGGFEFRGDDGQRRRYTLPGAFRVRAIYQAGRTRQRYFLEVSGVDRVGGTYTVLVCRKPYRSAAGVLVRPYRVRTSK